MIGNLDEITTALADPDAFLDRLLAQSKPLCQKLAIAKLKPKLEPHLRRGQLEWSDVVPVLEKVDTLEELEAAMEDPMSFLKQISVASGPKDPSAKAQIHQRIILPPRNDLKSNKVVPLGGIAIDEGNVDDEAVSLDDIATDEGNIDDEAAPSDGIATDEGVIDDEAVSTGGIATDE
jgi:hypothetical protein